MSPTRHTRRPRLPPRTSGPPRRPAPFPVSHDTVVVPTDPARC
jgi:hypothetical protein